MYRVLIGFVISVFMHGAAISKSSDPAASFIAFVNSAQKITKESSVLYLEHKGAWRKVYWSIRDVKYDVKKTDSLINPVIGSVSFVMSGVGSAFYASEGEAKASSDTDGQDIVRFFDIDYQFDGKKWTAVSAKFDFNIDRVGRRTVAYERSDGPRPDTAETRLINRWLPGFYITNSK